MQCDPGVEQAIRGTGIKTRDAAAPLEDCDIRDTAQIGDNAVLGVAAKNLIVKHRQERSALSTGRHIAAAEVADHRDCRHFRERIRIADLPGERHAQIGSVTQGLAVAADGSHPARADAGTLDERQRRLRKCASHLDIDLTHLIESDAVGDIDQRGHPALECGLECRGAGRDDAHRFHIEVDQCRIDGIHAGSGNHSKVKCHVVVRPISRRRVFREVRARRWRRVLRERPSESRLSRRAL